MMPIRQVKIGAAFRLEKMGNLPYSSFMEKDKPKRKSALDKVIGANVEALLAKNGLKKKPFAVDYLGIDDGGFRHLIAGRSRWNTWHLEMISKRFNIPPADLLSNPDITKNEASTESDKLADLLKMAREILESKTIFSVALTENIKAFRHSVDLERSKEVEAPDPPRVALTTHLILPRKA